MKFVINKDNLIQALQVVQRAVSPKNPLPILSGIKINAEDNKIFLSATDLDIGIQCSACAEVLRPGTAVLPERYFTELIRRLPDLPIFIETDEFKKSISIKYGQSEAVINGFPADEFPEISLPDTEINFSIPGEILREAVRQVVFAASTDESRPVYNGVLFEIQGKQVKVVATDTHRLALRSFTIENCEDINIELIIPGKTLNDLVKIIGNKEVEVAASRNKVFFITDNAFLVSRLIDGQFPNYRIAIPQDYTSRITLKTMDLAEAAERASLLEKEGSPVVRLYLEGNVLLLTVITEAGRLCEELPVKHEGEPVQIAFNSRYLSDALKVVGSEEIRIDFSGPLSPGIIRPVGNNDYFSLILPVRLRGE